MTAKRAVAAASCGQVEGPEWAGRAFRAYVALKTIQKFSCASLSHFSGPRTIIRDIEVDLGGARRLGGEAIFH